MNRTDEAVKLFQKKYGKTPEELGFPVIDIYEKQHAFIYAVSAEAIEAYKLQQNIVRWMIKWYVWPIAVAFVLWLVGLAKSQDIWHPMCVLTYIFYGIWLVLFIGLRIKVKPTKPLVKMGETVTYLNYGKTKTKTYERNNEL